MDAADYASDLQEMSVSRRISQITSSHRQAGSAWCEACGEPIPAERRAAYPSARLCISCKELEESAMRHRRRA